ncbi:MAG: ribonuclease PH [Candidatus Subteraquimicrobiales bacterium]|nr:ribonuclease PH [Candidatus Subteraquimicrobiales bacterium]
MQRIDGRKSDEIRKVKIVRGYYPHAVGSVWFELGNTKLICAATIDEKVPQFLKDTGQGWITAEYSMLPRSTPTRVAREVMIGKVGGRTQEIQRLIGRSLRAVANLELLRERTILIDCDVIQADGGTRTAAITASFIALHDALKSLYEAGTISEFPLKDYVAAVSVGIIDDVACVDLCYEEDVSAQVDMNVVMSGRVKFIEIQGTAERMPFSKDCLNKMLGLAEKGIKELIEFQKSVLGKDSLVKLD